MIRRRVDELVTALGPALKSRFGVLLYAAPSVVELDSSTDVKFSRHLIVHNVVFKDTRHAGAFVKYFAEEILPVDISQCVDLGVGHGPNGPAHDIHQKSRTLTWHAAGVHAKSVLPDHRLKQVR